MIVENGSTPLYTFYLEDDNGDPATELSPTVYISQNGAVATVADNAVSEIDATNAPGWYKVTLSADETDTDGPLIIVADDGSSSETWQDNSWWVRSSFLDDDDYDRIADHVLRRWFSNARASSHGDAVTGEGLKYNAMGMLLSSGGIVFLDGNLLKTLQEDESSVAYEREVETNSDAEPITGLRTPS